MGIVPCSPDLLNRETVANGCSPTQKLLHMENEAQPAMASSSREVKKSWKIVTKWQMSSNPKHHIAKGFKHSPLNLVSCLTNDSPSE